VPLIPPPPLSHFVGRAEQNHPNLEGKNMRGTSKALLTALYLTILLPPISAQDKAVWHNKKCAVCLTYDDALNIDLDNVVPILDSLGFKGTFYISAYYSGFRERLSEWKSAAEKGNELGNHTLFHPCEGKSPGREWVNPDYDLDKYTIQRLMDEIKMADILLNAVDGKSERTFAYPCGDMKAGDSSYVSKIKDEFIAARGVEGKMQRMEDVDLYNIGSYVINGQSGDELVGLAKKAIEQNALLVFLFHGVGGEHSLNVSLEAHGRLLHFLKQNEKDIWVAPLVEIAKYIKEVKQGKK
jgi:peptidoglycan/xylan/chitin deacetylase (PgdA/CDA1 family)